MNFIPCLSLPVPPSGQQSEEKPGKEEEKKKISLTPETALGFPPTLYIPEYFGLVCPTAQLQCLIERFNNV